jgi:type I restriction enzyme M protein
MQQAQHGQIVSFIWRIADDVLRDVFVRGKYRDVILPMTVIRRLDAVLEPAKANVLERRQWAEDNGIRDPDQILKGESGHNFYNTSAFTLKQLLNSPNQLQANFIDYLDGFSPNVIAILEQFEFRNAIPKLAKEDRIGLLIRRFTDPDINLSPYPASSLAGLDNHAMGTVFEELIRRFNEENNEEAGEHFTPRDVVHLMAELILSPVARTLTPGLKLIYDGACGTGGMLTVAEERLLQIAKNTGKQISVGLYGQEVNGETWAISRADQLIKGEGAENIAHGSTLADDAFPALEFDFMLSNPPYG